jgi:AcrR family transcriptional regulator
MGRRSTHTPEQLRELAIRSAHEIIAAEGLAGLSAREVARKIGYSPGTLYNLFQSLDDVILHVEALLLDALEQRLAELPANGAPAARLEQMARTYAAFCREHPKAWNLIFQHAMPSHSSVPPWYLEKIERLIGRVEELLAAAMPELRNTDIVRPAARMLWAGVHGISSLSTTDKLASVIIDPVDSMVHEFVTTYLAGLRQRFLC